MYLRGVSSEDSCKCDRRITCESKWWAISGALLSISFPDLTVMTLFVTSSKVSRTKPSSIAPIHCLLPTKFRCLSPEHAKRKMRIKNGCVLGLYQSCMSIDEGCNYTLRVNVHHKTSSVNRDVTSLICGTSPILFFIATRDDQDFHRWQNFDSYDMWLFATSNHSSVASDVCEILNSGIATVWGSWCKLDFTHQCQQGTVGSLGDLESVCWCIADVWTMTI